MKDLVKIAEKVFEEVEKTLSTDYEETLEKILSQEKTNLTPGEKKEVIVLVGERVWWSKLSSKKS